MTNDLSSGFSGPLVALRDAPAIPAKGLPGDGLLFELGIEVEAIQSMNALELVQRDLERWTALGARAGPPEELHSSAGDVGFLLGAKSDDRFILAAYYDLESFGAATLRIIGKESLDSPDVELLVESFEPRAANDQ